jgi:hypothetical protein
MLGLYLSNEGMEAALAFSPMAAAQARFDARTPIGSQLNTAGWERQPQALRDRAFFSAKITEERWLLEAQTRIKRALALGNVPAQGGQEAMFRRDLFIGEMQELGRAMGLEPVDPALKGTLQDPTSIARLRLVWEMNIQEAYGHARWLADQDPEILEAFPAQELVRAPGSRPAAPREWLKRWVDEEWGGAQLVRGRMVALKNDPVWSRISRFERPWPPFDFQSGMILRDVRRREAESLGLLGPDDVVTPAVAGFNDELEASVTDLSGAERTRLKAAFGQQVIVTEDKARWRAPEIAEGSPLGAAVRVSETLEPEERDTVSKALNLAAQVHTIGPEMPYTLLDKQPGDGTAQFEVSPPAIGVIFENAPSEEYVIDNILHEVGHEIDWFGLGGGRTFGSLTVEGRGFREAVEQSAAYEKIMTDRSLSREEREYLLRPREMWSRAYAQWVARSSGHEPMVAYYDRLAGGGIDEDYQHSAWDAEDFEAIGHAVEALIDGLGWLITRPRA